MQVKPSAVQELRQASGAGMMDCKKALVACANDATKAGEWLRKKGLAQAGKKAGRATSEGALWSYIHTGDRWDSPCARGSVLIGAVSAPTACIMFMQSCIYRCVPFCIHLCHSGLRPLLVRESSCVFWHFDMPLCFASMRLAMPLCSLTTSCLVENADTG